MEAARIATERGHQVTLFEKSGELGGAMKYVCLVPGKEKMRWYLDWIRDQLARPPRRHPAQPRADRRGAARLRPRAQRHRRGLVRARRRRRRERVVPFEESMACPKIACECHPGGRKMRKLGARVLLWGDGYAAADTAAFLASIGKQVTIVTENREFAAELEVIHMYVQLKRFAQGGCRGPPQPAVQAPGRHPDQHHRPRDPRRRGRPPGQGLHSAPRSRSTTSSPATSAPTTRCSTSSGRPASRSSTSATRSGRATCTGPSRRARPSASPSTSTLLFNPNHAILNELPIDVLAQLTREEAPSYTAERLQELMDAVNGSARNETVPA